MKTLKSIISVLAVVAIMFTVTACGSGDTAETKATNATETATQAQTEAATQAVTQAQTEAATQASTQAQADDSNDELVIPTVTGIWKHEVASDACTVHISVQNGNTIEMEIASVRGEGAQIATFSKTVIMTPTYYGDDLRGYAEFDYEDSFGNTGLIKLTVGENVVSLVVEEEVKNGTWGISNATGDYILAAE